MRNLSLAWDNRPWSSPLYGRNYYYMYIENVKYNCGLCSGGPYADIIKIVHYILGGMSYGRLVPGDGLEDWEWRSLYGGNA